MIADLMARAYGGRERLRRLALMNRRRLVDGHSLLLFSTTHAFLVTYSLSFSRAWLLSFGVFPLQHDQPNTLLCTHTTLTLRKTLAIHGFTSVMHTFNTIVAIILCWAAAPALAWPIFPWGSPTPIPFIVTSTTVIASQVATWAPTVTPPSTPDLPTLLHSAPMEQLAVKLDDRQKVLYVPTHTRSRASQQDVTLSREARLLALIRRAHP